MKDQRQNRRAGFYFIDDKPYVSVTQVLQVIEKPQLRWWFGKEVYYALVKNPELSEREALSTPYKASKKAASRGSTVHSFVEAYKASQAIIDTIPSEFRGYVNAFYSWIKKANPKIIAHEKTVVSKKYKYAGTLDMLAVIGELSFIVDIKTNKDANVYPESHLQNSAYYKALEEQGWNGYNKIDSIATLSLGENGQYTFQKGVIDFETFLAAKTLWQWKNKEKCKKLGY